MDNILVLINGIIAQRKCYGIRQEVAIRNGWVLSWSNASANWQFDYRVNKGKTMVLDANQIFVPASKKDIVDVINKLTMLPLYSNSFEY